MRSIFFKNKIHRCIVTGADVNYHGSITVCRKLMEAAGLRPFEFVHVNNVNNAVHWETYVIPGDDGEIILNGPVARLFQRGDPIVIMALAELEDHEIPGFIHTDVFVNKKNEVIEIVQNREKSIFKMDPID